MLRKYKNRFLEIIAEKGYEPTTFTAEETEMGGVATFVMKFKAAPFRFMVRNSAASMHEFQYKHTIFAANFPETDWSSGAWRNFKQTCTRFETWLREHVGEYLHDLMEPDLWQQIEVQKPLVSGSRLEEADMAPFSEEEKTQLRLSINEFRLLVAENFQPSKDQVEVIKNRLDYLSEALDRLNRIDWRGLAISTVLSISMALSLDAEKGKLLFNLFKQVFFKVVHLLQ